MIQHFLFDIRYSKPGTCKDRAQSNMIFISGSVKRNLVTPLVISRADKIHIY